MWTATISPASTHPADGIVKIIKTLRSSFEELKQDEPARCPSFPAARPGAF